MYAVRDIVMIPSFALFDIKWFSSLNYKSHWVCGLLWLFSVYWFSLGLREGQRQRAFGVYFRAKAIAIACDVNFDSGYGETISPVELFFPCIQRPHSWKGKRRFFFLFSWFDMVDSDLCKLNMAQKASCDYINCLIWWMAELDHSYFHYLANEIKRTERINLISV